MEQLRAIIAANVSRLRLERGLTQQELANQLNYSDKAVSKWERGESVPDISVLARIAAIFGVTVDYLITDHRAGKNANPPQGPSAPAWETQESAAPGADTGAGSAQDDEAVTNMGKLASVFGFKSAGKFTVTLMAGAAVWLLAVTAFVALTVFCPAWDKAWCCFVFAVPLTAIVLLIFNLLWGRMSVSFALMAASVWTVLGAVFVFFIEHQPWIIFLIGIPAQAMILLWQILHKRRKK